MEKLSFELHVYRAQQKLQQQLMDKGIIVNSQFIDFHNSVCPACKTEFKKSGKTLKGVGTVAAIIPYDKPNTAILYAPCKKCVKDLSGIAINAEMKNKQEGLEDYVYEKLGL